VVRRVNWLREHKRVPDLAWHCWYLVRRDHSLDGGWHPVNDDLVGTETYGDFSSDAAAQSTFSVISLGIVPASGTSYYVPVTCSGTGGGGGGGDSGCPASTVFTLLGSTDRADAPGTQPGWFELAEITLFNEAGENIAAQATYEILLEPSNGDDIVFTDGEVFDWTSGRFVVWQASHAAFHGESLVRITFPTPQVIVSAELYSTNYESFGTDAQIMADGRSLPIRFVYNAHPNQGAAHAACYMAGVETAEPCSTLSDPAQDVPTCSAGDTVVGGFASMSFNDQQWYLVRRDHSLDGGWHPVNDRRHPRRPGHDLAVAVPRLRVRADVQVQPGPAGRQLRPPRLGLLLLGLLLHRLVTTTTGDNN
jgi:hypothetical protein